MLHQPIFSTKEIHNKLRHYSLRNIPLLEEKIKKLEDWQKAEWMEYFNSQKEKAQAIQSIITQTDKGIDQMVYKLYELTEEEIAIVEGK